MDTNITKDLDREQIATLLKNHRASQSPVTTEASQAMQTAAAVVSDMLTSTYSTSDACLVVIELGADEPGVSIGGEGIAMTITARLGPLPEDTQELSVPEATVVLLDRACEVITDYWNRDFEAEGLNDRADRGHLLWSALNCDDAGIEFGRILRLRGGHTVAMDRWISRNA